MKSISLITCLIVISILLLGWKTRSESGIRSPYYIDEHPRLKIDTALLGIWKATEDTDKADFIYIENSWDVFRDHFKYRDKMEKDEIEKRGNYYYITYMAGHGRDSRYNLFKTFLSEVNHIRFLNIGHKDNGGCLLVKILDINKETNKITTARMANEKFNSVKSSSELRKLIEKNINNPAFYSDTLHFFKVSNFHGSVKEAMLIANQ